eukprot:6587840-Lingulodinium_polyedra.AAC.1
MHAERARALACTTGTHAAPAALLISDRYATMKMMHVPRTAQAPEQTKRLPIVTWIGLEPIAD